MLAIKAGAGVGVLILMSAVLLVTSRCDGCDGQTISASQNLESPTSSTATTAGSAAGPNVSIEVATGNSLLGLSDDVLSLSALGDSTTTTSADPDQASTSSSTSSTAATSSSSTSSTLATDQQATSTTVGAATTSVAPTTTTTQPTTTKAPTTAAPTTAATAPPVPPTGNVPASGQSFYINPGSGNDSNDGKSAGTAWKSLQTGLRRVQPGQTLLLLNGNYTELKAAGQAHYAVDRGGTSSNWVKIAAAPGHSPTIVASNGTGLLVQAPYVEVSGLTVRGSGFNATNNWGVGIAISETHHVRLVGNRVSLMAASGISVTGSSNYQVIGNEVAENAFWSPLQGSGISVWEPKNKGFGPDSAGFHDRIEGNRVYKNENKVKSQFKNFQHITDGNGIILDSGTRHRLHRSHLDRQQPGLRQRRTGHPGMEVQQRRHHVQHRVPERSDRRNPRRGYRDRRRSGQRRDHRQQRWLGPVRPSGLGVRSGHQ